jgi:hypothetical protein
MGRIAGAWTGLSGGIFGASIGAASPTGRFAAIIKDRIQFYLVGIEGVQY